MEIIAELEQTERGPYTGSLGYVNHSGDMDLNILIRTLVKQKNQLLFRAGAGIVADSVPENELEETRTKAKGLLLAL
jgi:anthranilate synthase component 1